MLRRNQTWRKKSYLAVPNSCLKATDYDIRIIYAVRALRELRQIKQAAVAAELGITESSYSKIENGYKAITVSQLKKIAKSIDVSILLILALAEADHLVDNKLIPISTILLNFIQTIQTKENQLSEDEVDFILSRIGEGTPVRFD